MADPDLSQFYNLDRNRYGHGPEFKPIPDSNDQTIDRAIELLRKVHGHLVSTHNARVRSAGHALDGWQGPAAFSFLLQLNDAKPDVIMDSMARVIRSLRGAVKTAQIMKADIDIANQAWEMDRPSWNHPLEAAEGMMPSPPLGTGVKDHVIEALKQDRAKRHRAAEAEYSGGLARDPQERGSGLPMPMPAFRPGVVSAVPEHLQAYKKAMYQPDHDLDRLVAQYTQCVRSVHRDERIPFPEDVLQPARLLANYVNTHLSIGLKVESVANLFLAAGQRELGRPGDGALLTEGIVLADPGDAAGIEQAMNGNGLSDAEAARLAKEITDAEADELADEVKAAMAKDAPDLNRIRELLGQLAQLRGKSEYQGFCREFFTHLGPEMTAKVAATIGDDEPSRSTMGGALATATRDTRWDRGFVDRLVKQVQLAAILKLLPHGDYSDGYLTGIGDHILQEPRIYGLSWKREALIPFLQALARNSSAEASYLNGKLPDGSYRIRWLLAGRPEHSTGLMIEDDHTLDQYYGLLVPAMKVSSSHDPLALLRAIGGADQSNGPGNLPRDQEGDIPDAVRAEIADELAQHLPKVVDIGSNDEPWKQRLFELAELNQEGTINVDRSKLVLSTVQTWTVDQLAPPNRLDDDALVHAGQVNGLAMEPVIWSLEHLGSQRWDGWKTLDNVLAGTSLKVAEPAGPVVGAIAFVAGFALDHLIEAGNKNGHAMANDQEEEARKLLKTKIVVAGIVRDPSLLPPDVQEEIAQKGGIEAAVRALPNDVHPSKLAQYLQQVVDHLFSHDPQQPPLPASAKPDELQGILKAAGTAGEGYVQQVKNGSAQG